MATRRRQRPGRSEPTWGPGVAVWAVVLVGCDVVLPALAAVAGRRFAVVSHWLGVASVAMVVATGIAWVVLERRRRMRTRRRSRGQCQACGFSVRESVDRCGECGHPLPTNHTRVSDAVSALQRMG